MLQVSDLFKAFWAQNNEKTKKIWFRNYTINAAKRRFLCFLKEIVETYNHLMLFIDFQVSNTYIQFGAIVYSNFFF